MLVLNVLFSVAVSVPSSQAADLHDADRHRAMSNDSPVQSPKDAGSTESTVDQAWWEADLELVGGVTFGRSHYPWLIQASEDYFDGRSDDF